ncbi:Ku DNA-binding complex, Ku70 subunit [Thozetella sp. PMI_491]|nr:Ku DNA-binding complex, Ku70 subunit [Thozetella sp. PMI_491]
MAWPPAEDRDESGDEGEEDEVDESNYKTQKDAVLFAIDVSASMMKPPRESDSKKADKDSALSAALKSAYEIMQQRIISQPKDMMGILLFGTEKSKFRDDEGRGGSGYPHCYLFSDLDVPAAKDVKALRALVEEDEDPDEILVPSAEKVSMSNVLFCANQIFTTKAPNFGSRRLFLITDNDDPHAGDKQAKSSAAVRAKDLYDLGVVIELFPISPEGKGFSLAKFYDDIVYHDPATDEGTSDEVKVSKSGDGLTLLKSLVSNINSKQTPKRSYFSKLPFEIAPGFTISVSGYNILHKQTPARSCYVYLGGAQPLLAQSETVKTTSDHKAVEQGELKKAYKFGGDYIYFNQDELKDLKKFGGKPEEGSKSERILRIIGFKPRSALPVWATVKKSIFVFPTEEEYVGSTRVFSALWQKLLKDDKMGIAWFIPRVNAAPRLVAILPSRSPDDEGSATPYLPAGLWLYPLPFRDDVRDLEIKPSQGCSNNLIDKMRPIIQNLQMPKAVYNPERYPNPSLQWHYKILQINALEDEVPEEQEDSLTKPRYRQIHNRVGGYMSDWKNAVFEEAKEVGTVRAVKREAEVDEEPRAAKRSRATKASEGHLSNAELKAAVAQDTLKKMTVAQLKDILMSKGVNASGKKADLVDALEQWVDANA